jgi:hypothetical protein
MRGLTSTIILVLVLAGLGAYIYFVDSKRPAGGIEDKQKVFAVEADKIEEVTVTAQGETTTLKKEDGAWKITAPIAADADSNEVSSLTSALAGLEVNRVVDENAPNLGEFGLAEPRIKVAFKAQGGASGELYIGEKSATQSDMYAVKPGDKRVFLVPAFQESSLAKKTFDLRDKRVLHFDRDKVDLIEVTTAAGSPAVQLARSGSEWAVKQPIQTRGDYSAVESLLTRLSTASMTKLVDPNSPQDFGLDTPAAVVTLGAGSTRATIEFSDEKDGAVYARDRSRQLLFTVDPAMLTDVKKTADDFRDKDLFEFRSFNALRVRVTRAADTYEFQKVTGTGQNATDKWQRVVDGKATDLDTTKVEDFLSKLSALRAQSFNATTNAAGNAEPALVASASYDTNKFERVRFIKGDTQLFGVREGESGVAVVDQSAFDETMKALDAAIAPPAPAAPAPPAK